MPPPNDTKDLPDDAYLIPHSNGRLKPSTALVDLLVLARSNYAWPDNIPAQESQQTIIDLENSVAEHLANLTADSAHEIVKDVYEWALPPDVQLPQNIVNPQNEERENMKNGISFFLRGQVVAALDALCGVQYIALVIASKIYRFCEPKIGAAIDRHASYFFNSLPVVNQGNATEFVREWAGPAVGNTKLATFPPLNYIHNRDEYVNNYLPLLARIAAGLNALPAPYTCAAKRQEENWTPADVEMAAYYWWAQQGSR